MRFTIDQYIYFRDKLIEEQWSPEYMSKRGRQELGSFVSHEWLYQQQDTTHILIGELPARPIPKGIPEAGLLAYIMVAKFVDHLPFYRIRQQFKRNHNWHLPPSTISDWFSKCCTLLEPLYELHKKQVLQTDYLQADESSIKVLDKDKKQASHQGYMCVYRNPLNKLVLFDYRKGRGVQGPKECLQEYTGLLQVDGYKVYKSLAKLPSYDLILVSCMAHIRRKFFDAKSNHKELADYALDQIQKLYRLESNYRADKLDHQARQQLRDEQARPIFEHLIEWVDHHLPRSTPKSPIGKALSYAKDHLPLLRHYLTDGRVEIDNNLIENKIRLLALGRKNYLFAGSHNSAKNIAMMYSFITSCKAYDINPHIWLEYTLQHIGQQPVSQLEDFLPHNFRVSQPQT